MNRENETIALNELVDEILKGNDSCIDGQNLCIPKFNPLEVRMAPTKLDYRLLRIIIDYGLCPAAEQSSASDVGQQTIEQRLLQALAIFCFKKPRIFNVETSHYIISRLLYIILACPRQITVSWSIFLTWHILLVAQDALDGRALLLKSKKMLAQLLAQLKFTRNGSTANWQIEIPKADFLANSPKQDLFLADSTQKNLFLAVGNADWVDKTLRAFLLYSMCECLQKSASTIVKNYYEISQLALFQKSSCVEKILSFPMDLHSLASKTLGSTSLQAIGITLALQALSSKMALLWSLNESTTAYNNCEPALVDFVKNPDNQNLVKEVCNSFTFQYLIDPFLDRNKIEIPQTESFEKTDSFNSIETDTNSIHEAIEYFCENIPQIVLSQKSQDTSFIQKLHSHLSVVSRSPKYAYHAIEVLEEIVEFEDLSLISLTTIRNLTKLDIQPGIFNLTSSKLAKFCISCLISKNRQIRLESISTLASLYNFKDSNSEIARINREYLHQYLKDLMLLEDYNEFHEAIILLASELAQYATLVDLEKFLQVLISFLSSGNVYLRSLAYSEIIKTARARQQTCWKMFSMYWRSISVIVVSKIQQFPNMLQEFSSLLAVKAMDFLVTTRSFTLGYLVLKKQKDTIQKMAAACEQNLEDFLLNNCPYIVSYIMVKKGISEADHIINAIAAIEPKFFRVLLQDLIESEPIAIVIEIIQHFDKDNAAHNQKIKVILQFVANMISSLNSFNKILSDAEKKENFFRRCILGIVISIDNQLNDLRGRLAESEKSRLLYGLAEMITFAGSSINSAVPQLISFLQNFLTSKSLGNSALYAWKALCEAMGESSSQSSEIRIVSYSLLYHIWRENILDRDIIMQILQIITSQVTRNEEYIPFEFFKEFKNLCNEANINDPYSRASQETLVLIANRCEHENEYVVNFGLKDLLWTINNTASELHGIILRDKVDSVISKIYRRLLDLADSLETSKESFNIALKCIGMLGAIDPNKLLLPRNEDSVVLIHNFMNIDENIKFITDFLSQQLVPCFKSSTVTKEQGVLAFAMQEFCRYCGWNLDLLNGKVPDGISKRSWFSLTLEIRNVISPFISSKYVASKANNILLKDYPMFAKTENYRTWLQLMLTEALSNSASEEAAKIFNVCSHLLKDQDISILKFLAPIVICHPIIAANEEYTKKVQAELISVLDEVESKAKDNTLIEKHQNALKLVFTVVDYCNQWIRNRRQNILHSWGTFRSKKLNFNETPISNDTGLSRVESFVSSFSARKLARVSSIDGSTARALFYWEKHIRTTQKKEQLPELYSKLLHIYSNVDDPDGMEGVASKFHVLPLDQEILMHESAERWEAAQSCYELILQKKDDSLSLNIGLMKSLANAGHFETILGQIDSLVNKFPTAKSRILDLGLEAAFTLNDTDSMKKLLAIQASDTFNRSLCELIMACRSNDKQRVEINLSKLFNQSATALKSSSLENTSSCYKSLIKLQATMEISTLIKKNSLSQAFYDVRLISSQGPWRQFIISVRRAVSMNLKYLDVDVSYLWLTSARIARKSGQTQRCYHALLNAMDLGSKMAIVDHARWWWEQGFQRKAVNDLQGALISNTLKDHDAQKIEAKAELLLAQWLQSTAQISQNDLGRRYEKVVQMLNTWENAYYHLGRYYSEILEAQQNLQPMSQSDDYLFGTLMLKVVQNYLKALSLGCKFVYETLPKFLTLWLDFGAHVKLFIEGKTELELKQINSKRSGSLKIIHDHIRERLKNFPTCVFLIGLSQMLSRIGHPTESVAKMLMELIMIVAMKYPRQVLWSIGAVCKSANELRATRAQKLLNLMKSNANTQQKSIIIELVNQSQKLTNSLVNLCNVELLKSCVKFKLSNINVSLLTKTYGLVVPTQNNLFGLLPSKSEFSNGFNPFSDNDPTIYSFLDEVETMTSLQRPRKVKIRGTDGQIYAFLCKPKDDLRKDSRLMEFNSIVNKYLKEDRDSVRRQLKIRTFAVIPLNEECGVIEWVNSTRALRDILLNAYKQHGVNVNFSEIRNDLDRAIESKAPGDFFTKIILPKYPPIFHEWFAETFPNPQAWLSARLNYSRTLAVMSMVGFVLGLGDRHGENILFDETCGDSVHVDFNCLFEKGLLFEKPEKVPFRLTHNMINAMGVFGYEGSFRKSCEFTMRLMRQKQDNLKSVLEAFIYDPLVEWNRIKKKSQPISQSLVERKAKEVLSRIESKLKGYVDQDEISKFSVEGQVQELIKQAVNPDNLARMYIGKFSSRFD